MCPRGGGAVVMSPGLPEVTLGSAPWLESRSVGPRLGEA